MKLEVGQQFKISSNIAIGYEAIIGLFSFVVEISSLEDYKSTPSCPVSRDLTFKLMDWNPGEVCHDLHWYIPFCLSHGHDQFGDYSLNFSPDLINGGDALWFLPDLFRWQDKFMYLYRNDAVELLTHRVPNKFPQVIRTNGEMNF